MSEWRELKLGRGLRVKHGWAFKGEHFRDSGEQIVLTPGNFHDGGGFKPKNGTEKFYDGVYPEQFLLKRGDVVTAMTEQAQGLLGSTATIPSDETFLHNQRIGLVEITDPEVLDLRYVYHLMNAPMVRRQLQATATGSKVRHTAPQRIQDVRVAVPDIPTQEVIAEVLDTVDALIENNRRRVAVLEEMARAIYREWFVKFRYPGHEDVPLVDSVLGPIPEGWHWNNLFAVADVGFGFSFKSPRFADVGPFQVIRIRDIPVGISKTFTDEEAAPRYAVIDDDVLIGMDGDFHMTVWTGEAAWLNQRVTRLRPGTDISPFHLLLAIEGQIMEWNRAIVGTTVAHLGKKHLELVNVLMPDAATLNLASAQFGSIMGERRALEQSNRRLSAIRDLLLPKLVTGQIDVSALDLDALMEEGVES